MKTLTLVCLLLMSCGGTATNAPPIDETQVLWQGPLADDTKAEGRYESTAACLERFGFSRADKPVAHLMAGEFICDGVPALGCTFGDGIYYAQNYGGVVSHEAIHWITGIGNEGHNKEPFITCDQLTNTGR
jgi:hypothetical protein